MTVRSVVCVILIRSLVVAAYPTSDNDGDPVLIELPVLGVAEFSGTAPVTGSVAIVGHAPSPECLPPSPSNFITPILTQALENDEASQLTELVEPSPPILQDNDGMNNNGPIPKKVILGAILAESFMAEKGAEIDAKLAEFDAFVEKELGTVGPIIQTALAKADTSEIYSNVDSAILEMESQISSELTILDEFIESELDETEELVESAENVSAEKDPRTELELAMLESFVESTLEKSEALVESELENINSLIESELAKVDSIVESELHNVDLFIERELAKTDAVVKSELSKMESIVENELATVENTMEGIADSVTGSSDPVCFIYNSDGNDKEEINEDQVRTIAIDGIFHVTGRTLITGSTGCPSPFNTGEPLPLYVESFPVFESVDDETYETEIQSEDIINDDRIIELPIKGEAVFNGVARAVGTCRILGACSCDSMLPSINSNISPPMVGDANPIIPLKQSGSYSKQYFTISENKEPNADADSVMYHKKQLPTVILRDFKAGQKPIGATILKGNVEFSGNADAVGSTRLSVDFPCPTLTASEEGLNGKKYIWISKKPCNKGDSMLSSINSNISPPMVGDANPIIPLKQSGSYSKQYFTISENNEPNADADSVMYHKKQLPTVILRDFKAGQKPIGATILKGDVEFSGNADAVGSTRLSVDFPCPTLTASEEGLNGKKYIWISKKPCNKDTPKQELSPRPKPDFPSFTEDFPETIIMDSNKNYEKHIGEGLAVDFGMLGSLPVDPPGTS